MIAEKVFLFEEDRMKGGKLKELINQYNEQGIFEKYLVDQDAIARRVPQAMPSVKEKELIKLMSSLVLLLLPRVGPRNISPAVQNPLEIAKPSILKYANTSLLKNPSVLDPFVKKKNTRKSTLETTTPYKK